MSTVAWLFIFMAVYLIRSVWKGQVFDAEGNFTLPQNTERLVTALITGDTSVLKDLDQQGPAGLNAPAPKSSFDDGGASGGGGGDAGGGSWAVGAIGVTPSGWDKMNERTPAQAVAWALAQKTYPPGYCERFVTVAYRGRAGGFPTAKAHADAMKLQGGTPPAGALVFIKSGNPAEHVCLSIGGGRIVSTDYPSRGKVGTAELSKMNWGKVRGWSAPVFK